MPTTKRMTVRPGNTAIDAAQRRLELAEALHRRSLQGNPVPQGGPVASVYGPGNALVDLASTLASAWGVKQANKGLQRAQDERSKALSEAIERSQQPLPPVDSPGEASYVRGERTARTSQLASALGPSGEEAVAAALLQRHTSPGVTVPYGAELRDPYSGDLLAENERLPGSGGGNSTIMQAYAKHVAEAESRGELPKRFDEFVPWYTDQTTKMIPKVEEFGGNKGVLRPERAGGGTFSPITDAATEDEAARRRKLAEASGAKAGALEVERQYDAPQAKSHLDSVGAKLDLFIKKADRIAADPSLGRATGAWNYLPSIYGGGAANVDAAIEALKGQLGFNELQEMRDNSKTGGALGNVTVQEIVFLQNSLQSLAQSQSKEQYIENLQDIVDYTKGMKNRLNRAFQREYGGVAPLPGTQPAQPQAPPPAERKIVRTGKDPQGRKVVQYDDGTTEYAD